MWIEERFSVECKSLMQLCLFYIRNVFLFN